MKTMQLHEKALLAAAEAYASVAHDGQQYGNVPYTDHLSHVEDLVISYGIEFAVAAWLHDVVEDTEITIDQLQSAFPGSVSLAVNLMTDPEGKNRKERKTKLYTRFHEALHRPVVFHHVDVAMVVKVADRLANVQSCEDTADFKLLKMYKKEYPEFRDALYREMSPAQPLWDELDELMEWGYDTEPHLKAREYRLLPKGVILECPQCHSAAVGLQCNESLARAEENERYRTHHMMKMNDLLCVKCRYVLAYRRGKEWMTPFPFEETDNA
jgi:hypothetical protein